MHLMDHVFNVLEALVDVQRAVMHRTLQTSKLYPIETFNLLEQDGLLQFHQDIRQHYQDVLKVSYSQHPHFTHPQHRVNPLEDNGRIHYVRTDYEINPITHNYEINNIEIPRSYKIINSMLQFLLKLLMSIVIYLIDISLHSITKIWAL